MYYRVSSAALNGLEAAIVNVEADVSDGMPMMELIGYLGSEVKEARERVRTAMKNSGFSLPPRRITVNISPAGIRKQGTAFDLSIAIALLGCLGCIAENAAQEMLIIGELGLDGKICPVQGVLPRVLKGMEMGYRLCLVPIENLKEASMAGNIKCIGISSLSQVYRYLNNEEILEPAASVPLKACKSSQAYPDFSDVKGQKGMKRCLEISAAGGHNLLMIGTPGAGKTMAAKRLPGIMPPLKEDEILELTKIYSVAGSLPPEGVVVNRPFLAPHHTCTPQAMSGGGVNPKPGLVSLAHKGVLFLDELPEFRSETLETLRLPMEEKIINISRCGMNYTYPANFLLVAAMNPCKCGYYPDTSRCRCNENDVKKYTGRISGPLLDRMDMMISAEEIGFEELNSEERSESSERILQRVLQAKERMNYRFIGNAVKTNAEMGNNEIIKYCILGRKEKLLMKEAFTKLRLSSRSYHKILKVSRTIADIAGYEEIKEEHLIEALAYRRSEFF